MDDDPALDFFMLGLLGLVLLSLFPSLSSLLVHVDAAVGWVGWVGGVLGADLSAAKSTTVGVLLRNRENMDEKNDGSSMPPMQVISADGTIVVVVDGSASSKHSRASNKSSLSEISLS